MDIPTIIVKVKIVSSSIKQITSRLQAIGVMCVMTNYLGGFTLEQMFLVRRREHIHEV